MSFFTALRGDLTIERDKDIIIISGSFGGGCYRAIRNLTGTKSQDIVFKKCTRFELQFYDVFIDEVIEMFRVIKKSRSSYGVNVKTVDKALEELIAFKEAENTTNDIKLDITKLKSVMRFTPLEYQMEAYKTYETFKNTKHYRGMLLDAATGTGKTFMGLSIAEMLNSEKILVICPLPTLKDAWINSVAGGESDIVYKEKQNYYSSKDDKPYNNERILLFHYESISKLNDLLKYINSDKLTILIDESHNFADSKSKRTLELLDFINKTKSENVILLSGTPVKAYATEIINVLRFLDRKIQDKNYERLFAVYAKPSAFFKAFLPTKYQNFSFKIEKDNIDTGLVTEYISITIPNGKDYTLNKIKKDMKEFIEKRELEIHKNMDNYISMYEMCLEEASKHLGYSFITNYKKVRDDMLEEFRNGVRSAELSKKMANVNKIENEISSVLPSELKKTFKEVKTIYKYPMLKIIGECLGKVILGARIACHVDIARHINYSDIIDSTHKDTIIFSNYIEVCEAAKKTVTNLNYKPVCVYGSETKMLNQNVELFKSDKNANPLISTYKALATGVRLTNANVILALDLPFRMYIYTQAISRAWRMGQDSETTVYIPTLDTGNEPNINQRNFDIISFFNKEVEALTGYKQEVQLENTVEEIVTESYQELALEMCKSNIEIKSNLHTDIHNNESKNKLLLW